MAGEVGLTDAKIRGLRVPAAGQVEHADNLIAGLRVRIGASGARTFILRKRIGGRVRNITLGRYGPRFNLAAARKKARDLLVDIESGRDPSVRLETQRKGGADTVRALIETYLAAEVRGKKRSAREVERILKNYVLPAIGDRWADSVTRGDVTKLIDGVINADPAKPTRAMGRAVFAQLSAFYSWAMPRLDRLPANPCRDAGRPAPSKSRDRVLTDVELAAFWRAADSMAAPFGPGFKLLLLTGQRRSEVFEADRSEVSGSLWTIPAARAKNGNAHLVPLSPAVQTLFEAQPTIEGSTLFFPSRSHMERGASGFSKALTTLHERMQPDEGERTPFARFTLHDLRRTMATGMQRLGVPMPVVEAILNHVSGSRAGVAGVYQRHDYAKEKRTALEAWSTELAAIVAKDTADAR